ncbi:MAG: class I SAM-dependent methyltransferase, partial [bacterium]
MRSLLSHPVIYLMFQGIIGAKRARRESMRLYAPTKPGQRILDIGCGTGYVVEYLPNCEYIGFDTDKSYINYAKNRYGNAGNFYCQKFDDAAADKNGVFDLVIMNGLLHHLDDNSVKLLLERVKRVLKPNAYVVTLDGCYIDNQSFIAKRLLDGDRGKFVREKSKYESLAS